VASRAEDARSGATSASADARPAVAASPPHLGAAIRAALTDYYLNSMRLVPANVVWGAGAIAVVVVGFVWPLGGLVLLPLLALPAAGIFHLAGRIVRAEPDVGLHDVAWPYRHATVSTAALGAVVVAVSLILGTNLIVGIGQGGPFGWILATLAGWGLVALWCAAIVAWPLVVDPSRAGQPLGDRLRMAGTLLLVDPIRFGALGTAVAIITVISIVLTAAILTVSVSFIALVACRSVYPAADRLEAALAGERP
jgi:uncharacterized membrane protein YesL